MTTTRHRLSSAELTSNDGFSVVAPMSVTVPSSTARSSESCCDLLNRWISSRNSTVLACCCCSPLLETAAKRWRVRASSMVRLTSATPPPAAADMQTNVQPADAARTRPTLVLPQPGGPQRMSDGRWPLSTAARSTVPGPSASAWPTTSSSVRGRRRSASGATLTRVARCGVSGAGRLGDGEDAWKKLVTLARRIFFHWNDIEREGGGCACV